TATGGSNFTWTPSTGPNAVSNPNIYDPLVTPVNPTTYHFTSDCGSDSVFINVSAPFLVDLGNDTLLCSSDSTRLHVNTTSPFGGLTYFWNSSFGFISDPATANPIARVTGPAAFYCHVSDSFGCVV